MFLLHAVVMADHSNAAASGEPVSKVARLFSDVMDGVDSSPLQLALPAPVVPASGSNGPSMADILATLAQNSITTNTLLQKLLEQRSEAPRASPAPEHPTAQPSVDIALSLPTGNLVIFFC